MEERREGGSWEGGRGGRRAEGECWRGAEGVLCRKYMYAFGMNKCVLGRSIVVYAWRCVLYHVYNCTCIRVLGMSIMTFTCMCWV